MIMTEWMDITTEEAYRLSQAEFKGTVIQALKDINRRLDNLDSYNNNSRYISMIIAGISGIVSGVVGAFTIKN